jgi:hypothetical protein
MITRNSRALAALSAGQLRLQVRTHRAQYGHGPRKDPANGAQFKQLRTLQRQVCNNLGRETVDRC